MGAERVDYYSDAEFRQAQELEMRMEQEAEERKADERRYYEEEYAKEQEKESVPVEPLVMQPNLLFPIHLENKDVVFTPDWAVKDMVEYFKPNGKILDPCKGEGAFLNQLPNDTDWCEIREGIDFFKCTKKYDWIIGNPPYSMYAKWVYHSMTIADRFVYLLPCDKPFISYKMYRTMRRWGMVKHIRVYGTGTKLNFPVGFAVGAIYWEKGWQGGLTHSFYEEVA